MHRASRRRLLTLMGATSAAAVAETLPTSNRGLSDQPVRESVRDRRTLAALRAETGSVRVLTESGRPGAFVLQTGAPPADDPLEGLFIRSSVSTGYWARIWDGVTGYAEWFGARTNEQDFDCRQAIEAALDLCVCVRLKPGSYHCHDTLVSRLPGRKLIGSGIHYAGDDRTATRVVVKGGDVDIFRMGPDHPPLGLAGGVDINRLHLEMLVEGIEFNRTAPPSTDARPRGVVVRHCQDPVVRRVKSQDSVVAFAWEGTIDLLMEDCRATRARPGVGGAPDEFVGYHATTANPALTDINGNASARIVRCIGSCTGAVANSTGLLLDGRFTDHSIVEFETATIAVGIRIVGGGAAADRGTNQSIRRNANVEIVRPWIDQFVSVGVRIDGLDKFGIVRISGGYFGPSAPATACIYDIGSQGTVLIGGEVEMAMAATSGKNCRGVLAIGSTRLLIGDGVTVMESSFRAFDLSGCADVRHMGATVNEQVVLERHTLLNDATACVIRPAMSGAASKVVCAVEITGGRTAACTIDLAAMNPAVLQGSDAIARRDALLVINGKPQGPGPFGAGNRIV